MLKQISDAFILLSFSWTTRLCLSLLQMCGRAEGTKHPSSSPKQRDHLQINSYSFQFSWSCLSPQRDNKPSPSIVDLRPEPTCSLICWNSYRCNTKQYSHGEPVTARAFTLLVWDVAVSYTHASSQMSLSFLLQVYFLHIHRYRILVCLWWTSDQAKLVFCLVGWWKYTKDRNKRKCRTHAR